MAGCCFLSSNAIMKQKCGSCSERRALEGREMLWKRGTRFGWAVTTYWLIVIARYFENPCAARTVLVSQQRSPEGQEGVAPHILQGGLSPRLPWQLHIKVSLSMAPLSAGGCSSTGAGGPRAASCCICCSVPGESKRNVSWAGTNAVTPGPPAGSRHSWYHVTAQVVL